jgi:hypothetical protein
MSWMCGAAQHLEAARFLADIFALRRVRRADDDQELRGFECSKGLRDFIEIGNLQLKSRRFGKGRCFTSARVRRASTEGRRWARAAPNKRLALFNAAPESWVTFQKIIPRMCVVDTHGYDKAGSACASKSSSEDAGRMAEQDAGPVISRGREGVLCVYLISSQPPGIF